MIRWPLTAVDMDAPTERLTPVAWSDPHPAVRAAERLLRVPDGTVRAATAELRTERAL